MLLAFAHVETVPAASAGSVYTSVDCKVVTLICLDRAKVKSLLAISASLIPCWWNFMINDWNCKDSESIATCSSAKPTISGAKMPVLVKGNIDPLQRMRSKFRNWQYVSVRCNFCKGHIEVMSELKWSVIHGRLGYVRVHETTHLVPIAQRRFTGNDQLWNG